jgi:hypothetical protein
MERENDHLRKNLVKNYGSFEAVKESALTYMKMKFSGCWVPTVQVNQQHWKSLKHYGKKQVVRYLWMA